MHMSPATRNAASIMKFFFDLFVNTKAVEIFYIDSVYLNQCLLTFISKLKFFV